MDKWGCSIETLIGSPATVATAGGRYFGFVVGSALPATVAASWPAAAWDQNGGISVSSWATTQADVDRSLEAILRIAAKVTQSQS